MMRMRRRGLLKRRRLRLCLYRTSAASPMQVLEEEEQPPVEQEAKEGWAVDAMDVITKGDEEVREVPVEISERAVTPQQAEAPAPAAVDVADDGVDEVEAEAPSTAKKSPKRIAGFSKVAIFTMLKGEGGMVEEAEEEEAPSNVPEPDIEAFAGKRTSVVGGGKRLDERIYVADEVKPVVKKVEEEQPVKSTIRAPPKKVAPVPESKRLVDVVSGAIASQSLIPRSAYTLKRGD